MWREAVLAALVPNPDRREESHAGARGRDADDIT